MSDPYWPGYPQNLLDQIGPRNMVHSWASDKDDPTVQPRWGKIGKQRIEDAGPLPPKRMETVDDEILKHTLAFMDQAHKQNKPFFVWLNPTRMHIFTFLSPKPKALEGKDNYGLQEAGMTEFDDIVGAVIKKLEDMGVDQNTIIVVTTDNGTEVFTWPDGGNTPFKGAKGMTTEGGFRVPAVARWPGKIPAGTVENGIMSGIDWFMQFYAREFWRFVFVQQKVAALAKTAIEFPPMQKGASFNLEAVKARIEAAVQARHGQ
jgi:arylsulfatase